MQNDLTRRRRLSLTQREAHYFRDFARRVVPVGFLSIALCACAATKQASIRDQCAYDLQAGWKVLDRPPIDAQELLEVETDSKTVRSQLGVLPSRMAETWIAGDGIIRYCRYTPKVDACVGHARSIDFTHARKGWAAEGPSLELICVD